jgi:hypothetical protein
MTINRRTLAVLAWPPAQQNEINRAVIFREQKMNFGPFVTYFHLLKEDSCWSCVLLHTAAQTKCKTHCKYPTTELHVIFSTQTIFYGKLKHQFKCF